MLFPNTSRHTDITNHVVQPEEAPSSFFENISQFSPKELYTRMVHGTSIAQELEHVEKYLIHIHDSTFKKISQLLSWKKRTTLHIQEQLSTFVDHTINSLEHHTESQLTVFTGVMSIVEKSISELLTHSNPHPEHSHLHLPFQNVRLSLQNVLKVHHISISEKRMHDLEEQVLDRYIQGVFDHHILEYEQYILARKISLETRLSNGKSFGESYTPHAHTSQSEMDHAFKVWESEGRLLRNEFEHIAEIAYQLETLRSLFAQIRTLSKPSREQKELVKNILLRLHNR